jgi:HAD superfamily hydrolase (TIGR01549 family)
MHFHNLVAEHKIDPLQMHRFRLMNTFARYHIVWNDAYLTDYRKKLVELSIPFSGVKPLLSRIKNKVKVGLITNAYNGAEQRERIRYSGLESFFDVITIAGEIGVYKPDPSLFLYALNCVDIAPGKALYIGDSVAYDVVGAKTAGMGTVLFSRQPQSNNDIADYTVQNMEKLKGLLDQLIG